MEYTTTAVEKQVDKPVTNSDDFSEAPSPREAKRPKLLADKELEKRINIYKETTMFFHPFHFMVSGHL